MKVKDKKNRAVAAREDKSLIPGSFVRRKPSSSKASIGIAHRSKRVAHIAKVTSKGQVTVPIRIRKHLQVGQGDRIEFLIGPDGKVTLIPATADVKKLRGIVGRPVKPVTIRDMNRAIEAGGGKK